MDYLFDDVYDNDYALEMTDEQLRRKADLQAKVFQKHPELKAKPSGISRSPKRERNELNQALKRTRDTGNLKYLNRAAYRNTSHAERVTAHQLAKNGQYGKGSKLVEHVARNADKYGPRIGDRITKKSFLGAVASESFEEGYVQALEDYGYFE